MRRVLSITLLLALFVPFFGPSLAAFAQDPEAGLPACCRSHGAHHCAMRHWILQSQDSRTRLAPAPCPLYPAAAAISPAAAFALTAVPRFSAHLLHTATPLAGSPAATHLFLSLSRYDRGPPALLA